MPPPAIDAALERASFEVGSEDLLIHPHRVPGQALSLHALLGYKVEAEGPVGKLHEGADMHIFVGAIN